jgi:hypothetical protein
VTLDRSDILILAAALTHAIEHGVFPHKDDWELAVAVENKLDRILEDPGHWEFLRTPTS